MATTVRAFILDREDHELLERAYLGVRAVLEDQVEEERTQLRQLAGLAGSGNDIVSVERLERGIQILSTAGTRLLTETEPGFWQGADVNGTPFEDVFIPVRKRMLDDVGIALLRLSEMIKVDA